MKKILCATILAALAFGAEGMKVIGKYKIGGEGRWDYITVDANARRLYVSHGASKATIQKALKGDYRSEHLFVLKVAFELHGTYENKSGVLKSVRLGRYSAESVPADFWLPNTGHDKKKYQVNIGNGFFQDFMMTFDFKNKIVVFERVD